MTSEQFTAIAKLIRSSGGAAQDAARMVLVDGSAPGVAALTTGLSPQAVSNVLRRYSEAQALIDSAWITPR